MSDSWTYVAALVEDSLGLMEGSLRPENLPDELVRTISSTLRGQLPADAVGPSLERQILSLLPSLRAASIATDGYFVRKARWPGAAPFAVCLTHDVDNISRPRRHIWRTRTRFGLSDLIGGLLGITSLYDNVEPHRFEGGVEGLPLQLLLSLLELPTSQGEEAVRSRQVFWVGGRPPWRLRHARLPAEDGPCRIPILQGDGLPADGPEGPLPEVRLREELGDNGEGRVRL